MSNQVKDLSKEAATSPKSRVGGYVILARLTDKARAEFLGGNIGDYHTDCPLDHMLLDWKGVSYPEIKKLITEGADDEKIADYLDAHGTEKTPDEVSQWSDGMVAANPYNDPSKKDWYAGETKKLGLDAATTPLFDWLEADDATIGKN